MSEVFSCEHRVVYAECTVGNHVYYGRYLEFLEEARGAFFRHVGQPFLQWQERDCIFPVVECHLRYRAPARYDDVLRIELWLESLERSRLTFGFRMVTGEARVILTGSTVHVCTSLSDRVQRVPEELAEALRPYVRPPSEA